MNQNQYQTLFEMSPDAIFILDASEEHAGRILSANPAAASLHGYSLDELLRLRIQDLDTPETAAQAANRLGEIRAGRSVLFEGEHVRKDGSVFPVEVVARAIELDGRPCVLAMDRDITSRRKAEEAINSARVAAEAASRSKSDFLATMSHEIRTPLNGVIGFTGLLADTKLTLEQREQVDIIRSSGESLLALINDILDFSKIEAGQMEVEQRPFDVPSTIQQTLALLRARAADKAIKLQCTMGPSVPATVAGDVTRLRQVLLNLVGNAIKFTKHGEVSVHVQRCEIPVSGLDKPEAPVNSKYPGAEPIVLQFTVRDTGIGIPADRLDRLFKPFSQVDSSTTRRYGGTGLGLAISKRLCELMGGDIRVESTHGSGSAFHFTIRVLFSKTPFVDVSETAFLYSTTANNGTSRAAAPVRDLRILLVEDNRVNQALALALLKKCGCETRLAPDGAQAIESLKAGDFDLVLMDICMPEMDGYEATHRIRKGACGPASRSVYIAAMTANAMDGDREKCLASGMNDYISKPINRSDLFAVLERAAAAKSIPEPRHETAFATSVQLEPGVISY